jgi:hypothetical protein
VLCYASQAAHPCLPHSTPTSASRGLTQEHTCTSHGDLLHLGPDTGISTIPRTPARVAFLATCMYPPHMQHANARSHLSDARFPQNVLRQGGACASMRSVNAYATTDAFATHTIRTHQAIRRSPRFMCARFSCVHNAEHRPAERTQQQPFLPPTSAPFPTWFRVYGSGFFVLTTNLSTVCNLHTATWPQHISGPTPANESTAPILTVLSPSHHTHTHTHTHHKNTHSLLHHRSPTILHTSPYQTTGIQALQRHMLFLVEQCLLCGQLLSPPPPRTSATPRTLLAGNTQVVFIGDHGKLIAD